MEAHVAQLNESMTKTREDHGGLVNKVNSLESKVNAHWVISSCSGNIQVDTGAVSNNSVAIKKQRNISNKPNADHHLQIVNWW